MQVEIKYSPGDQVIEIETGKKWTVRSVIIEANQYVRYYCFDHIGVHAYFDDVDLKIQPDEVTITISKDHAKALYDVLSRTSTTSWNAYVDTIRPRINDDLIHTENSGDGDYIMGIYSALDVALNVEE